jgi:hypothetical protein
MGLVKPTIRASAQFSGNLTVVLGRGARSENTKKNTE